MAKRVWRSIIYGFCPHKNPTQILLQKLPLDTSDYMLHYWILVDNSRNILTTDFEKASPSTIAPHWAETSMTSTVVSWLFFRPNYRFCTKNVEVAKIYWIPWPTYKPRKKYLLIHLVTCCIIEYLWMEALRPPLAFRLLTLKRPRLRLSCPTKPKQAWQAP